LRGFLLRVLIKYFHNHPTFLKVVSFFLLKGIVKTLKPKTHAFDIVALDSKDDEEEST